MKTPHEAVTEQALAHLKREEEEKRWSKLVNAARHRHPPLLVQYILFLVAALILWQFRVPGDYRTILGLTAGFMFLGIPSYFLRMKRREKALLALIEQEAPNLYLRLKHESIA